MMVKAWYILGIYTFLLFGVTHTHDIAVATRALDALTQEVTIDIKLQPNELLYTEYLHVEANNPALVLSDIKAHTQPNRVFDSTFGDTKLVFKDRALFTLTAHAQNSISHAVLHLIYCTNTPALFDYYAIPLQFSTSSLSNLTREDPIHNTISHTQDISVVGNSVSSSISLYDTMRRSFQQVKETVTTLIARSDSLALRILLVFLLGLLLSLTPCIYPMIPITVGVLQANATPSAVTNFLLSLAYTLGVALTFALFGLIAAFTGHLFGELLVNPLFVLGIVVVLGYLAFSMLGFYELTLPRFMQNRAPTTKGGSVLSAFLFGAASGTIASPCLSPGLALVLSMVATLGNKFLGFILLFAFGVGSSVPLLVIGTFSSALQLLPRAGVWMIEVKKLFGFMLLGMCFYYLSNILPLFLTLALLSTACFFAGLYYFYSITSFDTKTWRFIKNSLAYIFIVTGVFVGYHAVKTYFIQEQLSLFTRDYQGALQQARVEQKKIFLDIGATYCSLCKRIETKILNHPQVQAQLQRFIPVYIDATNARSEPYVTLQALYSILGLPTLLLINYDGTLIKRWGAEIYDQGPEQFARELQHY